jgi:hypothetical protein
MKLRRQLAYQRAMLLVMLLKDGDALRAVIMGRMGRPRDGMRSKDQHSAYSSATLLEAKVDGEAFTISKEEYEAIEKIFPYVPEIMPIKRIIIPEERIREFAKNCKYFAQNTNDAEVDFMLLWKEKCHGFVIVPFISVEDVGTL